MEKKFVSMRVTSSDSEYAQYRKDYKVPGTPTVLFLDSKGGEIDRIVGFDGKKDEYFQIVKDYAEGKNILSVVLSQLEENPEDVEVVYKLAEKYLTRYELDKAQPYYEKVLELDPEDQKRYKVEATYQIALYQARNKKNVEPLKTFIATGPEEKYLIPSYTTLAFHYQRERDNDKIIATYEEAIEKLPGNARLMFYYASAIFSGKIESHYEKGFELNEKAKTLDPELEQGTYYNMIQYYRNIGDTEKLIATFEEALKKWPEDSGMEMYYASTTLASKIESQYDRGIELAEKYLKENPKRAYGWNTLGQLYNARGDSEKAINAAKKAVELNPKNKIYQKNLEKYEKEIQE